jgi:hypothetical protein
MVFAASCGARVAWREWSHVNPNSLQKLWLRQLHIALTFVHPTPRRGRVEGMKVHHHEQRCPGQQAC